MTLNNGKKIFRDFKFLNHGISEILFNKVLF